MGGEWRARPVLAALLRLAVTVVPALASLLVVAVVAHLVPPPSGRFGVAAALRLSGLLAGACTVAYVLDRVARRLVPLAVLLRMSMLFPDSAPSRFRLARRACSTDVRAALRPREGDDAAAVAERIVSLLAALSAHDRHTRGHSQRVQVLAEMLARELGVSRTHRQLLRWAALLHDVGKLAVPAQVLTKPSTLAADEWASVRRHPLEGARLCGPLLDWLGPWGLAIPQHHERYDGSGYPQGLAGEGIAYAGRLVCLVDAYETMTASRPYKRAMATRDARAELARCAGTHFDPVMVRAFLAIPLPRVLWASGPLSFLAQLPFVPLVAAGGRAATAAITAAGTGVVAGGAAVVIAGAASAAPPTPTAQPTVGGGAALGRLPVTGAATAPASAQASVPTSSGGDAPRRTTAETSPRSGSSGPSRVPGATPSGTPTTSAPTGPVPLPTSVPPLPLPTSPLPLPTSPLPLPTSALPVPTSALPLPRHLPALVPSSTPSAPPKLSVGAVTLALP